MNLKTPDVTVETEEQYKTKVGMVKTDLISVRTLRTAVPINSFPGSLKTIYFYAFPAHFHTYCVTLLLFGPKSGNTQ